MPEHKETRILSYNHEFLFDLVADIEAYPDFLPWCLACQIEEQDGNKIKAKMSVGYKIFHETFRCHVTLNREQGIITVDYISGPLKHLHNQWSFRALNKETELSFFLDYAFKSRLLQKASSAFFDIAFRKMISAFEERAKTLAT